MPSPTPRSRIREHLLVLRCQAGDEDAFSDLYDGYGHRTMRYLRSFVGPDAAEDAQQEVWLAVFRGIAGLTNPGAFRTWLFQTTRHRAIDILRRHKRESEFLSSVAVEAGEDSQEDPDFLFDAADRRTLEEGMANLSDAHREVLALRFWEEMDYASIALIVGCSVGTIRSRLHHAKRALREILGREKGKTGQRSGQNEDGQRSGQSEDGQRSGRSEGGATMRENMNQGGRA